MTNIKETLPNEFAGFAGVEGKLVGPHLNDCSQKIAGLNPQKTAELCRQNDKIFAEHMATQGIDFYAALQSLKLPNNTV